MARRALLVLLLAALAATLAAGPAAAYPQLWVSYQIDDDGLVADAPSTCAGHPAHGEGSHEKKPVADADMTFTTSPAKVCPGADVVVTVSFPQPRFLLATSSAGALKGPTLSTLPPSVNQRTCPNRWVHGKPGGQTERLQSAPLTLSVPCGQAGDVDVVVTSTTGATSAYLTGSVKVPVATSGCKPCAAAAKPGAAAKNATAPAEAAVAAAPAAAAAKSGATYRGLPAVAVAVAVSIAAVVV